MKNILITGSNGFIGSCLLNDLNKDNSNLQIYQSDYCDKNTTSNWIHPNDINRTFLSDINCIIHLGAVSNTNASNTQDILTKNIYFTLKLIENCSHTCKIIFASSASVYGHYDGFKPIAELQANELGTSPYAQSKLIIDNLFRTFYYDKPYISLRFFNVCSFDKEHHKLQPSPTFNFSQQLKQNKTIQLFYNSSSIYRDFIFIEDVIKIIKHFLYTESCNGIFNAGSNKPASFEQIADAMIAKLKYGEKQYIPPPNDLTKNYQFYTNADITKLKSSGYVERIPSILEWIQKYDWR